jgi:hypothetical protein
MRTLAIQTELIVVVRGYVMLLAKILTAEILGTPPAITISFLAM